MYLSRLELNTKNINTMYLLTSSEKIHGLVESSFSGERKRNLWRLEELNGKLYLLILSPDQPDLSRGVERYGYPNQPESCQTKDYEGLLGRVKNGTWWHFKLVANPTQSCMQDGRQDGKKRGKVRAHQSIRYQEEWLLSRAEKHGFQLLPENFQVLQSDWSIFGKGRERNKNRICIKGVTYEGILQVQDVERFKHLLISGIGRGKAYGMGLLTIIPI